MIRYENGCFDCGADCTGYCTLKYTKYTILECDMCQCEVDNLYEYKGIQICEDFLMMIHESKSGACDDCECDDTLYHLNGRWLCSFCFLDNFEKVEVKDYE